MIFGYARVSSYKQKRHNTIVEQITPIRHAMINYAKQHGKKLTPKEANAHIYHEQYTGTTMKRPKFMAMIKKAHRGDIIFVAKPDRLSRRLTNLLDFIRDHPDLTFKSITPNITFNAHDKGVMKILAIMVVTFSSWEHDVILDRFKAGKLKAKASGKKNWNGGNIPRFNPNNKKFKHYKAMYQFSNRHSNRETAETFGVSLSTIQKVRKAAKQYFSYNKKTR